MGKRKKSYILLGITMILGGTALGTKAWLSDSKKIESDLIITTGTFNLLVDDSAKWSVVNNTDTEINNMPANNGFTNVRPGDIFKKTVKITNAGSLKQKLTVEEESFSIKDTNHDYTSLISISHNAQENLDNKIIEPGTSKNFDIIVKTNPDNMIKDEHEDMNINLKDIVNPITIEGTQINK